MKRLSTALRASGIPMYSVLGAVCAIGLGLYSPFAPLEWAGALWRGFLGLVLGFVFARTALPKLAMRPLAYALGLGLLFAASCVAGAELQVYGTFRLQWGSLALGFLRWLGLAAFFTLALLLILSSGGAWLEKLRKSRLERALLCNSWLRGHRLFWLSLGMLLLCWLPVWLAYFPGLANYDILSHMEQCVTGQYSTSHPALYTLLLHGCLILARWLHGGATLAIALLCWVQMLLMAGAMAHAVSCLRRMGAAAYACLLCLAFFALFPVFPLLTISTTKDVPYAAFTLLFTLRLLCLFQNPTVFLDSWKSCASLLMTGVLMSLLRYNGLLSLALWILAFWLFARQRHKQDKARHIKLRILCLLGLIIGLTLSLNQGLNALTRAAPSYVTPRDIASLPSQQMVRAALSMEEDSDEFREVVQWYGGAGMLRRYRPRLADYTKLYINVDHDNGWRGFAESWLKVGFSHPKAYLEAFLELNRGLWFAHDLSHANIYPESFPLFGYLLNNQADCAECGDPIHFDSKLPGLQAFLNQLTTENAYLSIPGLRTLFSTGFQCWLSALLFLAALYRKDRALACAMGWSLSLIIVLAVAPAVLVRYTLPVFLGNGVGLAIVTRDRAFAAICYPGRRG